MSNSVAELEKMQLVVLYNTESFDKHSAEEDPVTRESIVRYFDFNPRKRYNLNSVVT